MEPAEEMALLKARNDAYTKGIRAFETAINANLQRIAELQALLLPVSLAQANKDAETTARDLYDEIMGKPMPTAEVVVPK